MCCFTTTIMIQAKIPPKNFKRTWWSPIERKWRVDKCLYHQSPSPTIWFHSVDKVTFHRNFAQPRPGRTYIPGLTFLKFSLRYFLVVLDIVLLAMSYLLITLIKCLKGHKSLQSLLRGDYLDQIQWIVGKLPNGGGVIFDPKNFVAFFFGNFGGVKTLNFQASQKKRKFFFRK